MRHTLIRDLFSLLQYQVSQIHHVLLLLSSCLVYVKMANNQPYMVHQTGYLLTFQFEI